MTGNVNLTTGVGRGGLADDDLYQGIGQGHRPAPQRRLIGDGLINLLDDRLANVLPGLDGDGHPFGGKTLPGDDFAEVARVRVIGLDLDALLANGNLDLL